MDVYIGLDVSLASTAVCVLAKKGKILTEAQVASTPEALVSFMAELPHEIAAIGLEAGPLSHWLHKGMSDAGFEPVLMETRQVKAALQAVPIKTDRRDAESIARLLQMGWFRPVHCKSVSSQEMRALLTSRKSVVDALTNMELSLRGVLRNFGLKLGKVSKGRWEARVRELISGNAMLEAGDAALRVALYQAATVMLNRTGPNWLKAWAQRLTKLRGKRRATVALARRIGVVLHRMWRDGTEFRFTREEALALQAT